MRLQLNQALQGGHSLAIERFIILSKLFHFRCESRAAWATKCEEDIENPAEHVRHHVSVLILRVFARMKFEHMVY